MEIPTTNPTSYLLSVKSRQQKHPWLFSFLQASIHMLCHPTHVQGLGCDQTRPRGPTKHLVRPSLLLLHAGPPFILSLSSFIGSHSSFTGLLSSVAHSLHCHSPPGVLVLCLCTFMSLSPLPVPLQRQLGFITPRYAAVSWSMQSVRHLNSYPV